MKRRARIRYILMLLILLAVLLSALVVFANRTPAPCGEVHAFDSQGQEVPVISHTCIDKL